MPTPKTPRLSLDGTIYHGQSPIHRAARKSTVPNNDNNDMHGNASCNASIPQHGYNISGKSNIDAGNGKLLSNMSIKTQSTESE